MQKKLRFIFQRLQYAFLLLILFSGFALVNGVLGPQLAAAASAGTGTQTGVFLDSPVSGLNYSTPTLKGLTGPAGQFKYKFGQTVTFSIGNLTLGSATGAPILTPMSILGTADPFDQRVVNMCVLLQTLDQDGDLNNNIQITKAITPIVSGFAGSIDFNQTPDNFAADSNVVNLLAALNAASPAVFSDAFYRGPRTLQPYAEASAHFARSIGPRKIVHTANGLLSGFASYNNVLALAPGIAPPLSDTWQFIGVPYAAKPIGSLRWRPPHAPTSWSGVRQAIEWGDQSPQITTYTTGAYAALIGAQGGVSEDCLHLNITTPMGGSNLPVMVWFHGGAFVILTGNSPNFNNPAGLTTKGVVVVTVNHRLGEFGYLAHPLLTAESGYHGSGNYGQLDLIAALQWVKKNIAKFGGDPKNVTIFGESGGGGKVNSLMASPLAKGLFHKAICESGMFPNGAYPSPFFFLNTPLWRSRNISELLCFQHWALLRWPRPARCPGGQLSPRILHIGPRFTPQLLFKRWICHMLLTKTAITRRRICIPVSAANCRAMFPFWPAPTPEI
ncbi:MAG: carboxylesterase family protein [Smithellaceae bacterium]